MLTAQDSWTRCPWDLSVFFPWLIPQAFHHSKSLVYFLSLLPYLSTGLVWVEIKYFCSAFWRLYPPVQRETSWTIELPCRLDLATVCVWFSRRSLHFMHSIECLHIMRMMESHICTNRLWILLKCVHPFMKFRNDFWWRGTRTRICCQMWCRSIQNNQKIQKFCLQFGLIHGPRR